MLQKGDKLPDFSLNDENGVERSILEFVGDKKLVLYFYPKNFTPGCTKEACSFRDNFDLFKDMNANVVGISGDSPMKHSKFKKRYDLPFTLLSDTKGKARNIMGLKGSLFGLIPDRITFIINREGVITQVVDSLLEYEKHVKFALKSLRKNEAGQS